jgi:hypothetical protein
MLLFSLFPALFLLSQLQHSLSFLSLMQLLQFPLSQCLQSLRFLPLEFYSHPFNSLCLEFPLPFQFSFSL